MECSVSNNLIALTPFDGNEGGELQTFFFDRKEIRWVYQERIPPLTKGGTVSATMVYFSKPLDIGQDELVNHLNVKESYHEIIDLMKGECECKMT